MITVHLSTVVEPLDFPKGHTCLYMRRDMLPGGGYREYSYLGPLAEVEAIAARCAGLDMVTVDPLLRDGLSFEEALTKLGK